GPAPVAVQRDLTALVGGDGGLGRGAGHRAVVQAVRQDDPVGREPVAGHAGWSPSPRPARCGPAAGPAGPRGGRSRRPGARARTPAAADPGPAGRTAGPGPRPPGPARGSAGARWPGRGGAALASPPPCRPGTRPGGAGGPGPP